MVSTEATLIKELNIPEEIYIHILKITNYIQINEKTQ